MIPNTNILKIEPQSMASAHCDNVCETYHIQKVLLWGLSSELLSFAWSLILKASMQELDEMRKS